MMYPSTVAAEPLIAVSGVRSSWLTMPRNSARSRSSSSSGVMSWMVAATEMISPVFRVDGRGVDERAHRFPIREVDDNLFGAYRLPAADGPLQRQFIAGNLLPIHPPKGHRLQELLQSVMLFSGAAPTMRRAS